MATYLAMGPGAYLLVIHKMYKNDWKAKAKANLERVREEKNKKQLFDDGQYMVLADAEKLYNQLHPKDKK